MTDKVGIVGVGYEGFRPAITDISTRELMYQAASKAYDDAGLDPRKDVGSFICCTEDLWEGWSITDEMVPDQVGGARRPLCTVPWDGIIGMGHAMMQLRSGIAEVVSVEAHSKAADVLDKTAVENLAFDPAYHRVVGVNADVMAGREMSAFMKETGTSRRELSMVIRAEKKAAVRNTRASYGADLSIDEISGAGKVADPLRKFDKAEFSEAGIVLVLATERWIRRNKKPAVFIDGLAWRSSTPWFEGGAVKTADYARQSLISVLKQSRAKGIRAFDVLEFDDTYSFKLVQHLMSAGITKKAAVSMMEDGGPSVNPSGGSLGVGYLIAASGSHRVLESVLQLRGEAGGNQVEGAKRALALSWRGNPTSTGAAVALSVGRSR